MCGPGALALAAAGVSAIGKGVGAIQSAAMDRYKARVADQNAQLEADGARMSQENTRLSALRLYRKIGQTEGQQTAAMAANGIDLSSGSAVQAQQDTAMLGAEDVDQLYRQGAQDVRSYDIRAANDRAEAQGARQAASGAIVGGIFDVASTVLGGLQQNSAWKARQRGA